MWIIRLSLFVLCFATSGLAQNGNAGNGNVGSNVNGNLSGNGSGNTTNVNIPIDRILCLSGGSGKKASGWHPPQVPTPVTR